jgi:cell division protein FtsI/penicillin-binding protein 2
MVETKNAEVRRNGEDRAKIEAERGIVRDENGQIVLSKAQKVAKIAYLKAKIEDFANRTKNAKAMIKNLEK